jgi:hypothetical protein
MESRSFEIPSTQFSARILSYRESRVSYKLLNSCPSDLKSYVDIKIGAIRVTRAHACNIKPT